MMFLKSLDRRLCRHCAAMLFLSSVVALPFHVKAQEQAKQDRDPRPNILFIFSDDHGAQTISSYGSNRNRTPNLDRLATDGIRFANCFCTNSICAPSRATILTGKHTHMNGHTTNERIFDSRQETFPHLLQEAGYQTALIGKWHLNAEPKGFNYWDILINQGVYYNPPMIQNGKYVEREGYTTDIITDLTLDWLENGRDSRKPFLLLSHHKAPHRQWEPPLRYLTLYDDSLMPEPPTLFDDWSNRSSAWSHAEISIDRLWPGDLHLEIPDYLLTPKQRAVWDSVYEPKNKAFFDAKLSGNALRRWKYQRFAKDYLRSVQAIDDGVGRLLDYLDQEGLAKNTIVIYSSDQGWFLGEHGIFDKRWMYEESLRMPLLVQWPGVIEPGSVNTDLVQSVDFAQTLLEIASVKSPPDMQGRSLAPLLKGERPGDWRTSVYYQFFEDEGAHRVPRHYGVRNDRYKLIHYYKLDEWELFDLLRDPDELVSVYGRPEYKTIMNELTLEIDRLRGEVKVTADADREVDVFQKYQQGRFKFMSLLGKLPSRWNLKVERVNLKKYDMYTRELVRYVVGDQRIEAFILVPNQRDGLLPAVLAVHPGRETGTREFGKSALVGDAGDPDLSFGLDLCKNGYIVMIPDRFGFESRRLVSRGSKMGIAKEDELVAQAASAFLMNGSTLLGQEMMELWAAQNYLAKRPEVFYTRTGVMGYGEGGILASILSFINEEILVTVSVDGIRRLDDWRGKTGACDLFTLQGISAWGDVDEILTSIYPRPFLALSSQYNPDTLLHKARERYKDLDFTGHFQHRHFGLRRSHLTAEMRNEAFRWFDRWTKE